MIFRTLPALIAAALFCCSIQAGAAVERVSVCFNYGCLSQADVAFSDSQLAEIQRMLSKAADAADEREALSVAVGRLLGWAGEQTPIAADRGGNFADEAVFGKMDCIDHSTTTTRLLQMLERKGWLRFHRVLEPAIRERFLLFAHYSALIEENNFGPAAEHPRFVVDSWFFDNGRAAAVMPLAQWQAGESPNDDE